MKPFLFLLWQTGVVLATTIGAGMFALPYIFRESGWAIGAFYLLILSGLVAVAHYFYWRILEKTAGEKRLLKLSSNILGKTGFGVGFIAVIGGLFLVLVVYLLLGGQFLRLIFPLLDFKLSLVIFWFLNSFFLVFKERRIAKLEFGAAILMTFFILLTFSSASLENVFRNFLVVNWKNLFLPFGAVLFSLTAWTIVGPVYDLGKNIINDTKKIFIVFGGGAFLASFFYFLFVIGVFGSVEIITPDTISGLANWPSWKTTLLGLLGSFAIWTSYIPIGLEIRNSLEKDLNWPKTIGLGLVLFLPISLMFFGIDNFLKAIELTGGLFLSIQYLLIFLISRKILELNLSQKIFLDILTLVFALVAVYEIYYFAID